MNYGINIKQSLQLLNQSGLMLSKNQVSNKVSIITSKSNLIKIISKNNQITTITTINLMDSKLITKIIKEATLIRTKILNQDIRIRTTTVKVINKTISMEINNSKYTKGITIITKGQIKIVTIIIKQTIRITKCLNHILLRSLFHR